MKQIIAIMGKAKSGKSTVAKFIVDEYSCPYIEVGDGLKMIDEAAYGLAEFYKAESLSAVPTEIAAQFYAHRFETHKEHGIIQHSATRAARFFIGLTGKQLFTIIAEMAEWYLNNRNNIIIHNGVRRNALQYLGTEIMRNKYGEDVHINEVVRWAENVPSKLVAVGSVRFRNELEKLKAASTCFVTVVVRREFEDQLTGKEALHPSEVEWTEWIKEHPDSVIYIDNDGSYDELRTKTIQIMNKALEVS